MDSFSEEEQLIIRRQFDCVCKTAMKHEMIDWNRQNERKKKYEVLFSEMPDYEMERMYVIDEYSVENIRFFVLGYDIEVKDTLLAEALMDLPEKKRNVVLLYYYMEMSDAEIAQMMHLVRSTIHEHRKKSLEILRQIIERHEKKDEKEKLRKKS